ncbi:hypothetical protein [Magnetospirillum sp. ME-1]|uniref:hypothetical protein n=1 Tax=Magnetospirillum sp. ME-1 TaxID=1639348 RepID=UPI00143D74AC|nr:hypothetical protein [Magnetospirillum sp. ME-1]
MPNNDDKTATPRPTVEELFRRLSTMRLPVDLRPSPAEEAEMERLMQASEKLTPRRRG